MRHNTTAVVRDLQKTSTWKEYEVGTVEFWENIRFGILVGYEGSDKDYVGIVTDYYADPEDAGIIWIFTRPDPTDYQLPEGQDELPIAFVLRDKIWMETL